MGEPEIGRSPRIRRALLATAILVAGTLGARGDYAAQCADTANPQIAIPACNRVISDRQADATTFANRGLAHLKLYKYDEAAADLTAGPEQASWYRARAEALSARRQWERAAADVTAAIRLGDDSATVAMVEDLWPVRDIVLHMDRYAAFTLLSALAGAAWWGLGRVLRVAFRYGARRRRKAHSRPGELRAPRRPLFAARSRLYCVCRPHGRLWR
jgi:tetratricopeptide (TPR) repeat protein